MVRNVIEYLIESARKYPHKIALTDEHGSITFAELDRRARKLANLILTECGDIKNQPIAVYMEKSAACITAFLGILYSGNFYSPLDLKMPVSRIERIMDVLQPVATVYNGKQPEHIETAGKMIPMQDAQQGGEMDYDDINYRRILDTDPVYVLFTSGSTGQPKGVVISHRSVIDYTEWLYEKFRFDEKVVFGNQAPFYFDNSILDIYSTLRNGCTMNVIPENLFIFPKKLIEYINLHKINTLFWVPSALIGVANAGVLSETRMERLEKVLFCGEVMPNKQLNIWRREYPDLLYANLYGPTEITDVCTYYVVERDFLDDEPLPIGFACENTEILVLNDADALVKEGEVGELCVRGSSLSMGYYGDFAKSAEVFVQNPLNDKYRDLIYRTGDLVKYNQYGEIVYICRKDYQIKHQGYRIELGEIETICSSLEGIGRVCAVYDDINKKIVLYCSLDSPDSGLTEKTIYQWLKQRLPNYMLPAVIYIMETLPVNANGKIDRVKLKEML